MPVNTQVTLSGATKPTSVEFETFDPTLSASRTTSIPNGMIMRLTYTGDLPEYIGYAPEGLGEGDNGWLIHKFTYSGDNLTHREVAGVNEDANWTARATYF
jgi:hypothetical protein